jgi:glycerophosphoryl diester phosphodiesterase
LVFAHRGSSAALPEHTTAAYQRAIEEGADGLECDVRLSRDGHLVCVHDATIDRTSTGQGQVGELTLDELNRHDYGDGPGVLTLEALLDLALGAGRPLELLVETKHPAATGAAVEHRLVEVLAARRLDTTAGARRSGLTVTVMSFSAKALRRVHGLAPEISTVFLFDTAAPEVWRGEPPDGSDALGPGIDALREQPGVVRQAHDRGHRVLVWTVNTREDLDLVHRLGVDGVISDRPAELLSALGRTSAGR